MRAAKKGDTVRVHYSGRLGDGAVFDSSEGGDPLKFSLGSNQVIAGFDRGVTGMHAGETKTVHIPVEQAYGPYNNDMVAVVARDRLPADIAPEIGQQLQLTRENGEQLILRIIDISGDNITLDGNHPLAGEDLVFDITLVEIVKPGGKK
jgi:FKBP-type peptidyl-prolyl cis-trans isomerase 2